MNRGKTRQSVYKDCESWVRDGLKGKTQSGEPGPHSGDYPADPGKEGGASTEACG